MHKCWRSQEQACWPYMAGRENRRGEWMGLSVGNLSYRYLQISTFPQPKSVQKSFYMWSPSVTGHGLHRLGLNLTEFDLSGAARDDPPKTPTKSNEVKSKSNEAKLSWTWTCREEKYTCVLASLLVNIALELQLQLKATSSKSMSMSASPRWTSIQFALSPKGALL